MKKEDSAYTGYNSKMVCPARTLRKNMTQQERHLWYCFLQKYPIKFYRQRPIHYYIADFYCSAAKLVIEIDGSQHFSEDGRSYDAARTEIINAYGVSVLRFTNSEIERNFSEVCGEIDRVVKERTVESPPSQRC